MHSNRVEPGGTPDRPHLVSTSAIEEVHLLLDVQHLCIFLL